MLSQQRVDPFEAPPGITRISVLRTTLGRSSGSWMITFDELPVELIVLILEGSTLRDILSVSQTSTHFRTICFQSKQIWHSASDVSSLVVPARETLQSIPVERLPTLVLRALQVPIPGRAPPMPTWTPLIWYAVSDVLPRHDPWALAWPAPIGTSPISEWTELLHVIHGSRWILCGARHEGERWTNWTRLKLPDQMDEMDCEVVGLYSDGAMYVVCREVILLSRFFRCTHAGFFS
ncbi:hypothetical protein SISSUDRAFT_541805 [Sistotremastrum suecicum HHB10207 ss-3]|uniref:F-box domain-containing protein n=1 Tax=Sistotremastrum suecicum HHB10207 ss-3 TaxID=1314776 RepID=A0A165XQL8_9AGAM|nr:hypothetical protein SISSUDRAFT_541805 [Sistotremastrum suecicum HHB10207 ss-3]